MRTLSTLLALIAAGTLSAAQVTLNTSDVYELNDDSGDSLGDYAQQTGSVRIGASGSYGHGLAKAVYVFQLPSDIADADITAASLNIWYEKEKVGNLDIYADLAGIAVRSTLDRTLSDWQATGTDIQQEWLILGLDGVDDEGKSKTSAATYPPLSASGESNLIAWLEANASDNGYAYIRIAADPVDPNGRAEFGHSNVSTEDPTKNHSATLVLEYSTGATTPDIPSLSATAVSHEKILLSWDQVSGFASGAAEPGYEVWRKAEGEADFSHIDNVAEDGSASYTYADDGLSANTQYEYRVDAQDDMTDLP